MSTHPFRKWIGLIFAAILAHVVFVTLSQAKMLTQIGDHTPGQILVKIKGSADSSHCSGAGGFLH